MNFIINNADFEFTLETQEVNGQNVLTSFTATGDNVSFNCFIQLVEPGEVAAIEFCCSPLGCTSGPCRAEQIQAQSASSNYAGD